MTLNYPQNFKKIGLVFKKLHHVKTTGQIQKGSVMSQVAQILDYPNFFQNLDFEAPDGATFTTHTLSQCAVSGKVL